MELEELRNHYTQYDKKLSLNLKFNEELLRKMNLDSFRKEIQKPYIYEIINVIVCFIIFSCFLACSFEVFYDIKYSLSGFISSFITLIYIILSLIKIGKFTKIDYYNSPIIKLQKDLMSLKAIILRMRKLELTMLPLVIVAMFPILFKCIYNANIYTNVTLFITMVVIFLCVNFPLAFWLNKNIYDKKLKNANDFLDDLKRFENE